MDNILVIINSKQIFNINLEKLNSIVIYNEKIIKFSFYNLNSDKLNVLDLNCENLDDVNKKFKKICDFFKKTNLIINNQEIKILNLIEE